MTFMDHFQESLAQETFLPLLPPTAEPVSQNPKGPERGGVRRLPPGFRSHYDIPAEYPSRFCLLSQETRCPRWPALVSRESSVIPVSPSLAALRAHCRCAQQRPKFSPGSDLFHLPVSRDDGARLTSQGILMKSDL